MKWEDIIKQEPKKLFPLIEELSLALENRVREMEGFLKDSDEEDAAYDLAEAISRFSQRANGTGGGPRTFGLTDQYRNLIKMIDEKYAELVEMMR
jgi:hypothetical protein